MRCNIKCHKIIPLIAHSGFIASFDGRAWLLHLTAMWRLIFDIVEMRSRFRCHDDIMRKEYQDISSRSGIAKAHDFNGASSRRLISWRHITACKRMASMFILLCPDGDLLIYAYHFYFIAIGREFYFYIKLINQDFSFISRSFEITRMY